MQRGSPEWCVDRKIKATQWAQRLFDSGDAVILDTETTGLLDNRNSEIIEVAAINLRGEVLIDQLVKPRYPIPVAATKVHGIRNVDVAKAEPFRFVYEPLVEILNNAGCVLIYNKTFDLEMLERGAEASGFAPFSERCSGIIARDEQPCRWFCAMKIYSTWVGQWSSYRNDFTFKPLKGGHRALGDCIATVEKLREVAMDTQIGLL